MSLLLQNIIVLTAVVACVGYAGFQMFGTLFGRKGKMGSCCAKGCPPKPEGASGASGERVVFFPADALRVRRKS